MGTQSKVLTWAGWGLTVLIGAFMLFSASGKFVKSPEVVEMVVGKFGIPESLILPIGIVEVCCVFLYLIPQTAVLGAVLLTGYLGGATVTHLRINDVYIFPVIMGMLVWLALFLRDPRVRALLPIRRPMA